MSELKISSEKKYLEKSDIILIILLCVWINAGITLIFTDFFKK
jgi:hypothetical protein